MDCVCCGLRSGYNRVLVERRGGDELGGLCIECEEHRFSDDLRRADGSGTGGCALCAGEGHVHLPEWDPEIETTPDGTAVLTDYRVTDETVGLCEEHLALVTDRDPVHQPSPRTATDRSN